MHYNLQSAFVAYFVVGWEVSFHQGYPHSRGKHGMLKVAAAREGAYWNYTEGRSLVQLRNLYQVTLQTFLLLNMSSKIPSSWISPTQRQFKEGQHRQIGIENFPH